MATFVLVPGAWHGSWCWKRVRKALLSEGHDVFTPSLTGVGERSHSISPQVGLDTHIADIVNLLRWEELNDVVLCGHSYGGAVISGAADRVPERIKALVYLDAFILDDGQAVHDVLPAEARDDQIKNAVNGWLIQPITAEFFQVNAADRAWVNAQCTPQPLATFAQPVRLRSSFPAERCTHIAATSWEFSPFRHFHEIAKSRGWKTRTIDCGHDVMLDRPNDLVEMLREAAR